MLKILYYSPNLSVAAVVESSGEVEGRAAIRASLSALSTRNRCRAFETPNPAPDIKYYIVYGKHTPCTRLRNTLRSSTPDLRFRKEIREQSAEESVCPPPRDETRGLNGARKRIFLRGKHTKFYAGISRKRGDAFASKRRIREKLSRCSFADSNVRQVAGHRSYARRPRRDSAALLAI